MDINNFITRKECYGRVFKESDQPFVIAFGVNKKFFPPLGILLTSMVLTNPSPLSIHVGCSEIDEGDLEKLRNFTELYENVSITLYYIDTESLLNYVGRKNPAAAYYRVIMANALYLAVDKLLYMDVDTLFIGKFSQFTTLDLEGKAFMAVEDTLSGDSLRDHKKELGLSEQDRYFNSGVMYIDLKKWHENSLSEKVLDLLHQRAIGKRNFSFMDQGAMNIAGAGLWKPLPAQFNMMAPILRERFHGTLPDDTVILHFAGAYKPWKGTTDSEKQELSDHCVELSLFNYYRDKSLWRDFPGYDKSYRTVRLISRWMWLKGEKLLALKWYVKYLLAKFGK